MARKSASWLLRRAATNALTASSADAKLRCGSGAFGVPPVRLRHQRIAARICAGQLFGNRIKDLLTPSAATSTAAATSTTAATSAAAASAAAEAAAAAPAAARPRC